MALNLHSLLLVASFLLLLAVHPSAAHSRKSKPAGRSSFPSLDEARRFLERYGYMEPAKHPNGAATNDSLAVDESSLQQALRTYQEMNHLRVTGKLDQETIARMMTPRCGVPDIFREGMAGESRPVKFHVTADYTFFRNVRPWRKRALTYHFTSFIRSVSPADLRAICARSFQRWADVTSFTFREVRAGEAADIKIGFYSYDHGDGYPFDGPGGTWAHAFGPYDARLHFDGSEQWSTSTPASYQTDLESIAVHEIGHTLGLNHSMYTDAVMYAYLSSGVVKRDLRQDDINGIRALYPNK